MTRHPTHTLLVSDLDAPVRLDRALRLLLPTLGRNAAQGLIANNQVRVNGRTVWVASWLVKNGDHLEISGTIPEKEPPGAALFEDAWIVARHADLVVVNKPAGLLSHKTRASGRTDLLSLAQARFGPVAMFHRLDRDTSGLMLFTWPGAVNRYLDLAFKERSIEKAYIACVPDHAALEVQGCIRARLDSEPGRRERMRVVTRGGQSAETRYETLARVGGMALLRLWPLTGRTHQLRVHLAHLGAPILGDRLYGPSKPGAPRLMLHAWRLVLPELDGYPQRRFEAAPGTDFTAALPEALRRFPER